MNKDKIREIRDSWGNSTSIYELCNALLEDDKKFDSDWDIGTALRDVYPTKQKVDEVMPAPNVVEIVSPKQHHEPCYRCEDNGQLKERQRWIDMIGEYLNFTTMTVGGRQALRDVLIEMGSNR